MPLVLLARWTPMGVAAELTELTTQRFAAENRLFRQFCDSLVAERFRRRLVE